MSEQVITMQLPWILMQLLALRWQFMSLNTVRLSSLLDITGYNQTDRIVVARFCTFALSIVHVSGGMWHEGCSRAPPGC